MARRYSEHHLRRILKKLIQSNTQSSVAEQIGVSSAFLSRAVNGGPLTGKVVIWLGFRRVEVRVFEKL